MHSVLVLVSGSVFINIIGWPRDMCQTLNCIKGFSSTLAACHFEALKQTCYTWKGQVLLLLGLIDISAQLCCGGKWFLACQVCHPITLRHSPGCSTAPLPLSHPETRVLHLMWPITLWDSEKFRDLCEEEDLRQCLCIIIISPRPHH